MHAGYIHLQMKKFFYPAIAVLLLFSCRQERRESRAYSFFVAGHLYGKPWKYNNDRPHKPFVDYIPEINSYPHIAFGIFTGDVVRKPEQSNFDTLVKDLSALKVPWYVAPGNHDMGNRELCERYFGDSSHNYRPYREFAYRDDLFIILDGNLHHWNIKGKQLEFLKRTLQEKAGKSRNIFVFVHQLIFWDDDNEFKNIHLNWPPYTPDTTNYWGEVEPLLAATNKPVYLFSGDLGANKQATPYMYFKKGNITYIASGMGNMKNDNFIFVNVNRDGKVTFDLIALQGDPHRLGKLEDFTMP